MGWAGYVARIGRTGMNMGHWYESQKERDYQEDKGVAGWIILRWILQYKLD
jgi:hypothetical protein